MLNIVITGAPGSGKGTQSELIEKEYNLFHISTGDMLRAEIKAGSEIGKQAECLIADGKLVPDEIIISMLRKQVLDHKDAKGFIFDGFPRTVVQAEELDEMLGEMGAKVDILLCMDVEHKSLVERLLNRGKTSGRADDNLETIEKRLKVYEENTLPVIEFYKKSGRFTKADNNSTVEACFSQIKGIIDAHK